MTRSQHLKVSPRKFPFCFVPRPLSAPFLCRFPAYHRYQLAVINYGIINEDCSNLIVDQKICLGYEGEDCTTVYSTFLAQLLTRSFAHSAS